IGSYAGESVSATTAWLSLPSDVAVAKDGTLYIADFGNQLIRRVDSSRIIVTVAGYMPAAGAVRQPLVEAAYGPGADIGFASSIAVDLDGNVYLLTIRAGILEVWMV